MKLYTHKNFINLPAGTLYHEIDFSELRDASNGISWWGDISTTEQLEKLIDDEAYGLVNDYVFSQMALEKPVYILHGKVNDNDFNYAPLCDARYTGRDGSFGYFEAYLVIERKDIAWLIADDFTLSHP